jgi:hypothetical protein
MDYRSTVKELMSTRDSLESAKENIRLAREKISNTLNVLNIAEKQLLDIHNDASMMDKKVSANRVQTEAKIEQLKVDLNTEQTELKQLQTELEKLK